mgnify:FL=1
MMYKTIVTSYEPKAKKMAAEVEKTINEMSLKGWEFVTFSVTNSGKAILVFLVPATPEQGEALQQDVTPEAAGDAE